MIPVSPQLNRFIKAMAHTAIIISSFKLWGSMLLYSGLGNMTAVLFVTVLTAAIVTFNIYCLANVGYWPWRFDDEE